jgi:ribosomal protein S4
VKQSVKSKLKQYNVLQSKEKKWVNFFPPCEMKKLKERLNGKEKKSDPVE